MAYADVTFTPGEVLPTAKMLQLAENDASLNAAIGRLSIERPITYVGISTGATPVVAGTAIATVVIPAVSVQTRVVIDITCQAGGVASGGVVAYALSNTAGYPQGSPGMPGVSFGANAYATVSMIAWVTVPAGGSTILTITTGSSVNAIYNGTAVATRYLY